MLAGLKKLNLFFENKTLSQNRRRLLPRRRPQPLGPRPRPGLRLQLLSRALRRGRQGSQGL